MSLLYDNKKDVKIDRDGLDYLPDPESRGRFHKPYAFSEFVSDIHNSLRRHEIEVTAEEYIVQKDYQRLFGMMVVGDGEGYQMTLGVRGSHDQSVPRGIAIGTNVLVCSNLCFSGELFNGKAKQTIHNSGRILQLIDDAVSQIGNASEEQHQMFRTYKELDINESLVNSILINCFKRGGLSGAQLGMAIKEFDSPSYSQHREFATTWKLFNALTQAIKPTGDGVDMNGIVRKTRIVTNVLNEMIDPSRLLR
jgi:hypothetical protein